ncbi:MAG: hypothetical protein ACRDNZ_10455 [Streptosporangiaceae bacterium]
MTRYDADLGSVDPDVELRARMSASVADIHLPAGLLDGAVRRNHQRKIRNRLAGGVGAVLAIGTVAAVVAAVPGGAAARPVVAAGTGHAKTGHAKTGHAKSAHAKAAQVPAVSAQTAAFVLSKVEAAQVSTRSMISVVREGGQTGTTYTDLATQQQRNVTGVLDSSGQPYFQTAEKVSGGTDTVITVEYQDHVYSIQTSSSAGYAGVSSWLPLQSNSNPAAAFQQAIKSGKITVLGHQNLNGRDTILLQAPPMQADPSGLTHPHRWIWVDAHTYLVVQTKWFIGDWDGPFIIGQTKATFTPVEDQVSWLAPTPANLALLTVTPPAGFTQVPYSVMAEKYLGPIS